MYIHMYTYNIYPRSCSERRRSTGSPCGTLAPKMPNWWLAGCLLAACWLPGCLLAAWLPGCLLAAWLHGCLLAAWLHGCLLAAWLPGCLLAAWLLAGCLAAWLPGCLLAAWLPGCLPAWLPVYQTSSLPAGFAGCRPSVLAAPSWPS